MISSARPTHCTLCEEVLYYFEDLRYEPEFVIELRDPKKAIELDSKTTKFFVHQSCWNTFLIELKNIWKQNDGIESTESK